MPNDIDFSAAEDFLRQAREAYEGGDKQVFESARYLVCVALGLTMGPRGPFSTAHLREDKT